MSIIWRNKYKLFYNSSRINEIEAEHVRLLADDNSLVAAPGAQFTLIRHSVVYAIGSSGRRCIGSSEENPMPRCNWHGQDRKQNPTLEGITANSFSRESNAKNANENIG